MSKATPRGEDLTQRILLYDFDLSKMSRNKGQQGKRFRSIEERFWLYNEVMKLREQGLGPYRIAKAIEEKYGVPITQGVICGWLYLDRRPLGPCHKIIEGPDLAYVLGGWVGDGFRSNGRQSHYEVKIGVADYDFAVEWGRRVAKALGRQRPYKPYWDKRCKIWITRARSVVLYKLTEAIKKDMQLLKSILEKYPRDACRGFFDAEGTVVEDKYTIEATNTNGELTYLIKNLLENIGIKCEVGVGKKDEYDVIRGQMFRRKHTIFYRIKIYGRENIVRFAEEVGFSIKRKRERLMRIIRRYEALKMPKEWIEQTAKGLLAANLVRFGIVKTQYEAAKMVGVSQSTISRRLNYVGKVSKLIMDPEIQRLSINYIDCPNKDDNQKSRRKAEEAIKSIHQ